MHAFYVCQTIYSSEDTLSVKYSIPSVRKSLKANNITTEVCDANTFETIDVPFYQSDPPTSSNVNCNSTVPILLSCIDGSQSSSLEILNNNTDDETLKDLLSPNATSDYTCSDVSKDVITPTTDQDVIIWFGSTAAKTFQCRGWYRCDDEWQHQSELITRRRDVNLVRCAEDPKYRTRLCNHWDTSLGTLCPMRKKNKCIFAHGPVELRVKEAKRNRWGKLVDDNGDCNNQNHSGGEDTYGAARSIETERKQEGKWNTKVGTGFNGKGVASKKKKAKETCSD
jgi:hypothetical protein